MVFDTILNLVAVSRPSMDQSIESVRMGSNNASSIGFARSRSVQYISGAISLSFRSKGLRHSPEAPRISGEPSEVFQCYALVEEAKSANEKDRTPLGMLLIGQVRHSYLQI